MYYFKSLENINGPVMEKTVVGYENIAVLVVDRICVAKQVLFQKANIFLYFCDDFDIVNLPF